MKKYIKMILMTGVILIAAGLIAAPSDQQTSTKDNGEERILYLTFDDGPSEYTDELLDILAQHHMKATFFMLEKEMKRYPRVVQRMVSEGHAVGVHGVSHEKNTFYANSQAPVKEMNEANDTLERIIGRRTCLARTPYGSSPYLTNAQEHELVSHHYILWDWNIDSKDWRNRNAQRTFSSTVKMIENLDQEPKVVLFHDMKYAIETMNLMTDWMQQKHYTSRPITSDLQPVKLYRKKH